MVESDTNKKRIFYTIVLILTLVALLVSTTIAYYSLVASQKEEATVLYTGTLQIDYVDGVYIKNPELLPISNVNYNTRDKVYRNNFSITSSGTLDQTLSVDLEITRNDFNNGELKYALYNSEGTEMSRGDVPQSGLVNLANSVYLASKGVAKYTLIIWWENTGYNQIGSAGSTISGKITAYAKQIKY